MNLLTLSTKNAIIYNEANEMVASITDGNLASKVEDIYPLRELSLGNINKNISIYIPVGTYTVENLEHNNHEFTVNVEHINQGATITTKAKKVTFTVDDQKRINRITANVTEGQNYHIILESTFAGDKKTVEVSGTGTAFGQAGICQSAGQVTLIGGNITKMNVDGTDSICKSQS